MTGWLVSAWHHLRAFVVSQWMHTLLFLVVNVAVGALGLIAPIAVEYYYLGTNDFVPALKKQLDAAGAYTFAIAFLASSVSFIVTEYLDRKEVATRRPLKVLLGAAAAFLILVCAWFSGVQAARPPTDTPSHEIERPTASTGKPSREAAPQLRVEPAPSTLSRSDLMQIRVTSLAVLVGFLLFLLFRVQAPSMQEQLAVYVNKTKGDAHALNIKIGE